MENLKEEKTINLYNKIDDVLYYLTTHNKNYTKEQYSKILLLDEIISELKNRN